MSLSALASLARSRRRDDPSRRVWASYTLLAGVLLGYLVLLLVRRNGSYSLAVDGWGVVAFEMAAGLLCIAGALHRHQGRGAWVLLGAALMSWASGDLAVTVQSIHGGAVPVPSIADLFYIGFYPLTYIGVVCYLRSEVRGISAASWLDGVIAGLGAAALCAMFAFHRILHEAGGGALQVATKLAYPIGDLLLLSLVAAATSLLTGRRRLPWFLIAGGIATNVIGDTFNLFGSTAGATRLGTVMNAIAWPISMLLISLAVWLGPEQSSRRRRRGGSLLPGVAALAALVLLFLGTLRRPGGVAIGLATATLFACGLRLVMTIWELGRLTEQRRRLAITDELTGLGNRRHLFQVLDDFFAEAGGSAGEPRRLAFLFADLNQFKEINDSFGHPAGDRVLTQLGQRLLPSLRADDTLVRLGGDEFAVVLDGADSEQAVATARRLAEALSDPFDLGPVHTTVGVSIGIALAPGDANDTEGLLWCADVAMYRAKLTGGTFALFDPEIDEGDRWTLVEDLHRALEEGQLVLHYQPQLDLQSGQVIAVEALVRWVHPKHGMIPPAKFLPLAEDAGLMGPLTTWVLNEAAGQCARWRAVGRDVAVSVNVSATNLLHESFPELVRSVLDRYGLTPVSLVLEITETTLITDFDRCKAAIDDLRALGVAVSIDDFGAGFTSLAHLSGLPVRELKLDRVFISGLSAGGDSRELQLVRSTIELGHALGLRVVAEGVEDGDTLQLLSELGCDLAQGYYISHPKPAAELAFRPVIGARSETASLTGGAASGAN